jgi:hypothetical protein
MNVEISTSKLRETEDDVGKPDEQVSKKKKDRSLFSYNRNMCDVAIKKDLAT